MDHRVFVVRCLDYAQAEEKLGELLALMGGGERYAKPGERIVMKVNLLQPAPPEAGVCTHPAVAAAAARSILAAGAEAVIADSPGAGYRHTAGMLKKLYEVSGLRAAAEDCGAQLNQDLSAEEVSFPEGKLVKRFEVMSPVRRADGVWDLCKLKTHVFMGMTGAVKNNFGVIPGIAKTGYHTKLQEKDQFADMLLDLADFVSPRLSIMDAVVGLEGDGPGVSGTPRPIGLLLASEDPLALDVVAGELMGLPRGINPLLLAAERRGRAPNRIEDVEVVGPPLEELRIPDFRLPANAKDNMTGLPEFIKRPFTGLSRRLFSGAPKIGPEQCVGCGICADSCPAKAIRMTGGGPRKARIDPSKCIRCYCCHELCPQKAVSLGRGLLGGHR